MLPNFSILGRRGEEEEGALVEGRLCCEEGTEYTREEAARRKEMKISLYPCMSV